MESEEIFVPGYEDIHAPVHSGLEELEIEQIPASDLRAHGRSNIHT